MQRSMGLDLLVLSLRPPRLLTRALDGLTRAEPPWRLQPHIYRSAIREAAVWVANGLARLNAAAFAHELNVGFLCGFAAQGIRQRT